MHMSLSRRVRPGFVLALIGLIAVTTAAYGFQHIQAAQSTRAEADLVAAAAQLEAVAWPAPAASFEELCPPMARCLRAESDPKQAVEERLAALHAAGFRTEQVLCEGDFDLGSGCHGHARLGEAAVAVGADLQPPAGSGSLVIVSEPFLP